MRIINWLNRNKPSGQKTKWEDTEEGKTFVEKYKESLEKRKCMKEEWERTTPPEKKEQVKLFKIIVTVFIFVYLVALFWGFKTNRELYVLLCEACISLLSLIFFFVKPKFVKYPNCFMMPVIALGCMLFMYIQLGTMFGFDMKNRGKENVDIFYEKSEADEIKDILNEREELSKSDFDNLEYTRFLKDNGFETKNELKKDYENYRRNLND